MKLVKEYLIITVSAAIIAVGIYFFKFPNHFTYGGVSGLSVVLSQIFALPSATFNLVLNMLLLAVGLVVMGRGFAIKTAYASIVLSLLVSGFEMVIPLEKPLTNQPMLELVFAILLPGVGAVLLFQYGASGGGTDIIALILKEKKGIQSGRALLISDVLITCSAFFVFDLETALFSFVGMLAKSLVIDDFTQSINLCKYFTIVCKEPDAICHFITQELKRSATVFTGMGAYTNEKNYIVFTVLKPGQAHKLRKFIKTQPSTFSIVSSTSEIIGKGFRMT